MKHLSFLLLLCGIQLTSQAQLGKTYREVQALYGEVNLPGLSLRTEGNVMVEDKKTADNEVRMMMYNKDSVVVVVAIGRLDTSITQWVYLDFLKNEMPDFKMNRATYHDGSLHQWDTVHHYLIVYGPAQQGKLFPNSSMVFITDPDIIKFFVSEIEEWKE
jgi:hypothetical protein